MKKLFFALLGIGLLLSTIGLNGTTPFDRMDRNNDGKLSRSEFRGPPPVFNRLDKNNDGYISRSEAKGTRLLQSMDGDPAQRPQAVPQRIDSSNAAKSNKPLRYIDTHNHVVGRRSKGQLDLDKSVSIALENMNAAGIKTCFLMPMPQTENQNRPLYLEDLLPVVRKYPDRFALLGGGGSLNVMIQQAVKEGNVSKSLEQQFDAKAAQLVKQGIAGFGETTAEHFSMKSDHPYVAVPPDHPLFLRLSDLAAQYNLPIDLHMEAVPEQMPLPSRLKSPPNPKTLKANIPALKRLLAHNRKAKIVWVHLGWDNTGKRTVQLTRELMKENGNLYCSLRIASGMQQRHTETATFPLDGNGRLKADWLALFREFPDRFLIGSDEIIMPRNNHPSAGSITSTVSLLEQLPEDLKKKIGYENASKIYRLKLQN